MSPLHGLHWPAAVVGGLILAAALTMAQAQTYPDRPIRMIVPSAPGGGADILTRFLVAELAQQLGQQIVVDNRPGASGVIGMQMLARAAPDGYTLGYGNTPLLAINRSLIADLPYDVEKQLQPIGRYTSGQNLLAVRNSLPVKSVQDLIEHARRNPDRLSFGSSGNGTTLHLGGELFKLMTGTRMQHVPYKAITQAITELIGGQLDLIFDNQTSIAPHVRSGKVRGIAVTGARRSPVFPDLPTVAESGVAGYEVTVWTGMIAPAGLPATLVRRLNDELVRACGSAALKEKLAAIGNQCLNSTPEEFTAFIRTETRKWADVVKRSGAKVD
jgi:tripartite-type tricarboxylate transporter receptor subunit TctC